MMTREEGGVKMGVVLGTIGSGVDSADCVVWTGVVPDLVRVLKVVGSLEVVGCGWSVGDEDA